MVDEPERSGASIESSTSTCPPWTQAWVWQQTSKSDSTPCTMTASADGSDVSACDSIGVVVRPGTPEWKSDALPRSIRSPVLSRYDDLTSVPSRASMGPTRGPDRGARVGSGG